MGYVQRDDLRQAASDSKERFERGEAAVVRGAGERGNRDLLDYAKWLEWDSQRAVAANLGEKFSATEPFSQDVLVGRIRDAVEDPASVDWDSFVQAGARRGVRIAKRGKKNTIRYGMVRTQGTTTVEPTSHQTRRDETLGAEFTLEALEQKWAQQTATQHHQATIPQPTVAPTTPVPDKSEKATSSTAVPDMAASADAPLSQDAKYADAFADLWAEREATKERDIAALKAKLGIGKTLAEIDAEKAAEAAVAASEAVEASEVPVSAPEPVESQETAFSAAAANTATPADAPLSQASDGQFRSLLRQVRVRSENRQQVIDAMAGFEERAVASLEATGEFPGSEVPNGVGRDFLDRYGGQIDPEVLYFLELRRKKLDKAAEVWEHNQIKAKRMRAEVAAGNFEMAEQTVVRKPRRLPRAPEAQVENGGPSLG